MGGLARFNRAKYPHWPAKPFISHGWGRSTTDPRYLHMRGGQGDIIYAFAGGPVEFPAARAASRDCVMKCTVCSINVMPKAGDTNSSIAGDR